MLDHNLPKVYLAGPEVFRPDSVEYGKFLVEKCARVGIIGLYPMDNVVEGKGKALATSIFEKNMEMIKKADAIIVNMEPFRGPSMDVGASFEMGVAKALNKPIVAYTNNDKTYLVRVLEQLKANSFDQKDQLEKINSQHEDIHFKDEKDWTIENFNLADNLMMDRAVAENFDQIYPSFDQALLAIKNWFDQNLFEYC